MRTTAEPTYAVQLARPFWTLLQRHPAMPAGLFDGVASAPDDLRLSVGQGQAFLREMVKATGDQDLGLRAAQETALGAFEVLEFVARSAPTWRDAIATTFRYVHLMNEAADFRIELAGGKAQLVLHSSVPLTRAGIDFQSAAFHLSATRWFDPIPPELEVWFTYPEPAELGVHREVFGAARLRFDAPWNGFVHDAVRLDTPISSTDPTLHRVLREHAERLLEALAPGDGLVEQTRAQLLATLQDGLLGAEAIAERLGMSRRTLTRRLGQQGTSFTALREGVRRQAALHYLASSDECIDDIAFLLGFSESSAFVRAFKRWQGVGPTAYRREIRKD